MNSTTELTGPSDSVLRQMTAMDQLRAERRTLRLSLLFIGVIGFGVATVFLVESSLGAASWNVLAEGISLRTGMTFGWATNMIAVLVLLSWIPLKESPGLETFLNVFLVGIAADVRADLIPYAQSYQQQVLYYGAGLVMLSICCALYLGAQFGAGPRDGLMTGLVRATGKPIWIVRTIIELCVVALGFLMGGVVGFGTLLIAIAMGPLVQLFPRFTTVRLVRGV
ncbi:membrane protein YczE [Nocardia grenadensis]